MLEIERKFRLNKEKVTLVIDNLKHLSFLQTIHQVDKVFLFQCESFKQFKPGDPVMRIRTIDGVVHLAYKRRLGTEGNVVEHEIIVDSEKTAQAILTEIGYTLVTCIEKDRTEYEGDGVTVCLDDVVGLGKFIEIEIMCDSESQVALAEDKIMGVALKLGLDASDIETKKYDQLMNR